MISFSWASQKALSYCSAKKSYEKISIGKCYSFQDETAERKYETELFKIMFILVELTLKRPGKSISTINLKEFSYEFEIGCWKQVFWSGGFREKEFIPWKTPL